MDYYSVLGLAPGASAADIKRAYRRLSRRFHQGINPGDRAAQAIFQRITEAYETLSDPARRTQYDASGGGAPERGTPAASLQFTEFDFSEAARGPQAATFSELFADVLHPAVFGEKGEERGIDIHASVTIDFIGSIRGAERQIVVTRQVPCSACRGSGRTAAVESRCGECHATGTIRWARGHMVFSRVCPGCGGSGRRRVQRCGACGGTGQTVRGEAVSLSIPPGVADGARLRIPEHGHAGRHGGQNGDLYVTVSVHGHPFFRRDGDDLICIVPVAVHEAVLGARIEVPGLDGPVKLRIPPGTQAGQRFRIAGRGVPGHGESRGDLIVEVKLVLPEHVDDRSKELMREFGARNGGDVRKGLWT